MKSALARWIAVGCGSGYAPFAPGTWGTLAAVPFAIGLNTTEPSVRAVLVVLASALAIWAAGVHSTERGIADPKFVVSDEFAGYFIAAFSCATLTEYAAAFFLFRVFDVLKPWPCRSLDRWSKGQLGKSPWALGAGIVIDDLVAGLYAWGLLEYGVKRWLE